MTYLHTLRRVLLAGALSLATGLASAGISPPPSSYPSDDNDDTDLLVMIIVGGLIGSSVSCASDAPSLPSLCNVLGIEE
ncbi:MAG: hypothetical protein PVI50_03745 [Gammaproteobacteria bacterium]|jgi:hypothetical protein